MSAHLEAEQVTRIRPATRWSVIDPAEVWRYRELLWMLALRDIKVRYKQTVFGVAWAILPPFMTMVFVTVMSAPSSSHSTASACKGARTESAAGTVDVTLCP